MVLADHLRPVPRPLAKEVTMSFASYLWHLATTYGQYVALLASFVWWWSFADHTDPTSGRRSFRLSNEPTAAQKIDPLMRRSFEASR